MHRLLLPVLFLAVLSALGQDRTESKVTVVTAVTADGREVLLKADGTWQYSKASSSRSSQALEPNASYEELMSPERIQLFFDDYVNKYVMFKTYLGKLQPIPNSVEKDFSVVLQTIRSEKIIGG